MVEEDRSAVLMKMVKRLNTGQFSSIEQQPRISVHTPGIMGQIRLKRQKQSIVSTAFSNQLTNFTAGQNKRPGSIADSNIMRQGNFSPTVRGYFSPSQRNRIKGETPFTDNIMMNIKSLNSPSNRGTTPMSPVESPYQSEDNFTSKVIGPKDKRADFSIVQDL